MLQSSFYYVGITTPITTTEITGSQYTVFMVLSIHSANFQMPFTVIYSARSAQWHKQVLYWSIFESHSSQCLCSTHFCGKDTTSCLRHAFTCTRYKHILTYFASGNERILIKILQRTQAVAVSVFSAKIIQRTLPV